MKRLLLIFSLLLTSCGTNIKIATSGPIQPPKGEAALLLQYDFHALTDQHEVFFLDEDMHRYNVKVPADVDTKKGIVIYLPTNKKYALTSIINVQTSKRMEYQFGKDLTLFSLNPDYLTRIPYFEFVGSDKNTEKFAMKSEDPNFSEVYKKVARENFQSELPIRTIKIEEWSQ